MNKGKILSILASIVVVSILGTIFIKPAWIRHYNLKVATQMFDVIQPGMNDTEAGKIVGIEPNDIQGLQRHKGGWSKDFGWSLKPEGVQLNIYLLDHKVARAELLWPYDPKRKGQIIVEKGIPKDEWDKAK